MSDFLWSQVLVAITLIIECFVMQFQQRHHVLLTLSLSCILVSAHFYLLTQYTASAMFLLSAVRFVICVYWQNRFWMLSFLLASSILCLLSYQSYLSLLGLFATSLITVASFTRRDQAMRLLMLAGSSIWLIHNVLVGTPLGIVLEAVFVSGSLLAYYRFYGKARAKFGP